METTVENYEYLIFDFEQKLKEAAKRVVKARKELAAAESEYQTWELAIEMVRGAAIPDEKTTENVERIVNEMMTDVNKILQASKEQSHV
jgi:predicted  nucleic acid-binding Zn-ribbon protein